MTEYQDDASRTNEVVVAVFVDQDTAEQAIADLREAGLCEDDIVVSEHDEADRVPQRAELTPARGAVQGAVSGGIVGGALGVVGSLLLPGIGAEMAGGLLGAMLAGGVLGSIAGALIGALVTLGTAGSHAEPWDHAGGTQVTVLTDGRSMDARTILGLLWKKRERRNLPSFNYFGPDRRFAAF
jgi:uncharacterized membrane protein